MKKQIWPLVYLLSFVLFLTSAMVSLPGKASAAASGPQINAFWFTLVNNSSGPHIQLSWTGSNVTDYQLAIPQNYPCNNSGKTVDIKTSNYYVLPVTKNAGPFAFTLTAKGTGTSVKSLQMNVNPALLGQPIANFTDSTPYSLNNDNLGYINGYPYFFDNKNNVLTFFTSDGVECTIDYSGQPNVNLILLLTKMTTSPLVGKFETVSPSMLKAQITRKTDRTEVAISGTRFNVPVGLYIFSPPVPLAVTATGSLPASTVGQSYTSQVITNYVKAGGGSGNYSFSVSGLPTGLSFDTTPGDKTFNEIIGTPASSGVSSSPYTLTVKVTDTTTQKTVTCSLKLTVNQSPAAPGGSQSPASQFAVTISFTVGGTANASSLAAGQALTAHFNITNNQSSQQPVIAVVALFDTNGTMTNVSYSSQTIAAGATTKFDVGGFTLPSAVTGYVVKAFLLEGTQLGTSTMRPLSGIAQIPSAGQ